MVFFKEIYKQYLEHKTRIKEAERLASRQKQLEDYKHEYRVNYYLIATEISEILQNNIETLNVATENKHPRNLRLRHSVRSFNEFCYKIRRNRTNELDSTGFVACEIVKNILQDGLNQSYIAFRFVVNCHLPSASELEQISNLRGHYLIKVIAVGNRQRPCVYTGQKGTLLFKEFLNPVNMNQLFRDIYICYPDGRNIRLETGQQLELLINNAEWVQDSVIDTGGVKSLSRFDTPHGITVKTLRR